MLPFDIGEGKKELILSLCGVEKDGEVTGQDIEKIEKSLCRNVHLYSPTLSSVSEGGTSIAYNTDAFLRWYNALCAKTGSKNMLKEEKAPTIKDITHLW